MEGLPAFVAAAESFLQGAVGDITDARVSQDHARVGLFPDLSPEEELEELQLARSWRSRRFEAGFGWITGPVEHGGRGLSAEHEQAYAALERHFRLPRQRLFDVGVSIVVPMLLQHGSIEAKRAYLPGLVAGEFIGCQLFSEPGAGSDLARIATSAERDGDIWRITGQKVWSSSAHLADVGLLVARTGAVGDLRNNLTAFVVPMRSDGVSVVPIRQMTGGSSFNEVFLDDVLIPDHLRLGSIGEGFGVILDTLMHERAAVGSAAAGGAGILSTRRLASMLMAAERLGPVQRDRLMRLHCSLAVSRWTRTRLTASVRSGGAPGPIMSLAKLALTDNLGAFSSLVGAALGMSLVADG